MFFGIDFNGYIPAQRPSQIRVIEQVGHHQVASITLPALPSQYLREGTPVHIGFGLGADLVRDFVGYINHTKPTPQVGSKQPSVEVVAVGATRPMKTAQQKTWNNVRVSQVLKEVATTFYLDAEVHDPGYAQKALIQPGNVSTWQFLSDLATQSGLLLAANGTRLLVRDPKKTLDETWAKAPVYNPRNPSASFGYVYDIEASLGKHLAPSQRAFSVDDSGTIIGAQYNDEKAEFEYFPIKVSHDHGSAKNALTEEFNKNRLSHRTSLTVDGNPSLYPTSVLGIDGLDENVNGYWTVVKATHILTALAYRTELEVGRETRTSSRPLAIPRVRPLRTTQRSGRSQFPKSTLVAGKWRAA